jgi:hypothetical protein
VHRLSSAHASLTGVAKRKVKLSFTITAARNASAVKTIAVGLPKGMSFSSRAKHLTKGVSVTGRRGKRLKFTASVRHGVLTITLKAGATSVQIRIVNPAIAASGSLASKVKRRRLHALAVVVRATDASRTSTRFVLSSSRSQLIR